MEISEIYDLAKNAELTDLCNEVKALYLNGDFIIKKFQLSEIPSLKSSFARLDFFTRLTFTETFQQAFAKEEDFDNIDSSKIITNDVSWLKSIKSLETRLAGDLHWAGAYTSMETKRAQELSKAIINIICLNALDSHYADIGVEWSSWFCCVAWDYSFIIFDTKLLTLTIVCATDTD